MDYRSHAIGGALFALGMSYLISRTNITPNTIIIVCGSITGSIVPDIDHPNSFIGKKIPIIPDLLYCTVGHRTLTHSLLFALVVGAAGAVINYWIGIGLSVGILSHISLDMLSPYGVAFLYPFKKSRIKLP